VIRVRYKDQLTPGLHGQAERSAHGTTVYLVPGLTGGQRRAALRRLRQEASRGCGPALPGADLTAALAADRCRAGVRRTAAVIRLHPVGSLLPTALAVLLMVLFMLASVSARLPQAPVPGGLVGDVGATIVIGYPSLAQTPWSDPDSGEHPASGEHRAAGEHKAAGGLPGTSWSLAASSSGSGTAKGAGSRRLPWPPPAGGWPHFWPAGRSAG
jgi:hypothetical protein